MGSAIGFQGFDWTGGNAEKNLNRHNVSAADAEQFFFNKPLLWGSDDKHSGSEVRFYALGQTDQGRRLFAAFTMRDDLLRVISVRDMSRQERKVYRS